MFKNHFVLLSFRISVAHKLIYSYVICKECNMAFIFVKQKQVFLLTMLEKIYIYVWLVSQVNLSYPAGIFYYLRALFCNLEV